MRGLSLSVSLVALSLLTAGAAQAGWREVATPADRERLSLLDESKQKGLEAAAAGPDLGAIRSVLEPRGERVSAGELQGGWHCRTIKLGGMTPSRVYSWFSCRVSDRGGHLFFQKVNGTTRTSGYFYPSGDGKFVYLGANSMSTEPWHEYSGSGASIGAVQTPDDQIGLVSMIGEGHARIEMPYPVQESAFDVIEMRR